MPPELTWRQETQACSTVRLTGTATLTVPAPSRELWLRFGDRPWRQAKVAPGVRGKTVTLTLDGSEHAGQAAWLPSDEPESAQ